MYNMTNCLYDFFLWSDVIKKSYKLPLLLFQKADSANCVPSQYTATWLEAKELLSWTNDQYKNQRWTVL